MRIVYPPLNLDIILKPSEPVLMVIENPQIFSEFVENYYNQVNGKDGSLLLSEDAAAMNLSKHSVLSINPFELSCNDKKILNAIYSEMTQIANDQFFDVLLEINAAIIDLIDEVNLRLPYPIESQVGIDFAQLMKVYDVKVEESDAGLLDRMVTFIRLVHQVRKVELFTFINLRSYLSYEQIADLYEACLYEGICVIDVEGKNVERLSNEKMFIIDKDACIITVN